MSRATHEPLLPMSADLHYGDARRSTRCDAVVFGTAHELSRMGTCNDSKRLSTSKGTDMKIANTNKYCCTQICKYDCVGPYKAPSCAWCGARVLVDPTLTTPVPMMPLGLSAVALLSFIRSFFLLDDVKTVWASVLRIKRFKKSLLLRRTIVIQRIAKYAHTQCASCT